MAGGIIFLPRASHTRMLGYLLPPSNLKKTPNQTNRGKNPKRPKKNKRRDDAGATFRQANQPLSIQQPSKQLSCGSSWPAEECGVRQEPSHGVFPGGCPASWQAGPCNRFRRPVENHPLVKSASCCSTNGKN